MTRLSDALKKAAAETSATASASSPAEPEAPQVDPAPSWQFAPVETMHVPNEPVGAALAAESGARAHRRSAAEPAPAAAPPRHDADGSVTRVIRVGDADRNKLVIDAGVHPNVIEQYRHLAAVMHHAQTASGVRSVMVTSAMASEGKTLTATNLALTLSQSYQRRVLLIDADLRRPRLREMFALPVTEGLTDSLANAKTDRLPVQQISPTLWVLTSGRPIPDPMSTLVSPAMKQLLDDACDAFDWVVVDTPPIAILPDANLLSAMIDTALLVVSAESTPYPMVQRAAKEIGEQRILGVVLNRAEKSGDSSYDYYSYRGYQRPSGQAEPKRWFNWIRKPADSPPRQHHVQ
jgi:capsular exopolysaccharide synthesis family protein